MEHYIYKHIVYMEGGQERGTTAAVAVNKRLNYVGTSIVEAILRLLAFNMNLWYSAY